MAMIPSKLHRLGGAGLALAMLIGCAKPLTPFAATRAGILARQGEQRLKAEDYDAALAEFRQAVELNPKLAIAHSRIGLIAKLKGDLQAAAEAYAKAVKLDPQNFEDAFSLAQLYHQMVRVADAVRAYMHACELDPKSFEARLNLGVCYHQAGELDNAIDCYTKATQIDETKPAAFTNLGAAYDAKGEAYLYEAIHAYNESLERDPNQPMVLVNLAGTLLKQGRYPNARRALERAIQIDPQLPVAYERLGYCCFLMKNNSEALTYYDWAKTLNAKMPEAYAGHGVVRMAMYLADPKDAESRRIALENWHRSLELKPDQPKLRNLVKKYQLPSDEATSVFLGEVKP